MLSSVVADKTQEQSRKSLRFNEIRLTRRQYVFKYIKGTSLAIDAEVLSWATVTTNFEIFFVRCFFR